MANVILAPLIDTEHRKTLDLPEGLRLDQIIELSVAPYVLKSEEYNLRVTLSNKDNIMVVEPDMWRLTTPKAGVNILIRVIPGGDQLKSILQIAVAVGAAALGQAWAVPLAASIGVSTAVATGLITLGVTLVGGLLINTIFPANVGGQNGEKPVYAITGWKNELRPDGFVPEILGKHRYAPPFGASNNVEISGDKQYIRALFCVGYGPLKLRNIKIGDTPIEKFEHVQLETREGYGSDAPLTIYRTQVITEQFGAELRRDLKRSSNGKPLKDGDGDYITEDQPVTRFTASNITSFEIIFHFPAGLIQVGDSGDEMSESVSMRVRYRLAGTSTWTSGTFKITGKRREGVYRRRLYKVLTRGRYEVEVTRMSDESIDPQKSDRVVFMALKSLRPEYPLNMTKPLALIAVRIRATYQLNSTLDELNVEASRVCPDWDYATQTWITRETSNPASLYRYALQSPSCAYPSDNSEIDLDVMADWHNMCRIKDLKYDRIHDFEASQSEVLIAIAAAGRASPHHDGVKWSVVIDRPTDLIADHISEANAHDLNWQHSYVKPPHAFRVSFLDMLNNYEAAERIIPWPGHTGDILVTESLDLPGKVDPREIYIEARRRQYEVMYRPTRYTAVQDGVVRSAVRGDTVKASFPTLNAEQQPFKVLFVRDQSVTLAGLVKMEQVVDYAACFMKADAEGNINSVVRSIFSAEGEFGAISFKGTGLLPDEDGVVMIGRVDHVTSSMLVAGVERGEQSNNVIIMIDSAPIIDQLIDAEVVPAWNPGVGSELPAVVTAPMLPELSYIASGDEVDDGADNLIQVHLTPAEEDSVPLSTYGVRHRIQGTLPWSISSGDVATGYVEIGIYSRSDIVELQYVGVSDDGVASVYSTTYVVAVGGEDIPRPLSLQEIAVTGGNGALLYSYKVGNDPSISKVAVYRSASSTLNRDTDLVELVSVASFSEKSGILGSARTNMLANPDFATDTVWTKGTGWTITGGKAVNVAGSSAVISQALTLIATRKYRYSFITSGVTGGAVNARLLGTTIVDDTPVTTNVKKVGAMVAVSGNNGFGLLGSSAFAGSIDDAILFEETVSCLPQGTHYIWLEPFNSKDKSGPLSGPYTVTVI